MGDARAAARTWLAERYRRAETLCDDSVCHECGGHPCESHVLDAILSAPGVQVEEKPLFDAEDWESPKPTHTQVVIRLPAQPIKETP